MSSITHSNVDPFSNAMASFHRRGQLGSAAIAEVFGRLISDSALDGDLTDALAQRWGTQAGHYARLALAERENFTVGLGVIRSAFPEMAGVR